MRNEHNQPGYQRYHLAIIGCMLVTCSFRLADLHTAEMVSMSRCHTLTAPKPRQSQRPLSETSVHSMETPWLRPCPYSIFSKVPECLSYHIKESRPRTSYGSWSGLNGGQRGALFLCHSPGDLLSIQRIDSTSTMSPSFTSSLSDNFPYHVHDILARSATEQVSSFSFYLQYHC